MVFERPPRPGSSQSKPATQRPKKKIIQNPSRHKTSDEGGRSGHKSGGRHRDNSGSPEPSPWLQIEQDVIPSPEASFVEYLRWMRAINNKYKDSTKLQILQMTEEGNYRERLTQLTNRTRIIAGEANTFQVKCFWRVRVGGHHGPENILLPAFDSLGMPYIPSSTLRGVARTQAIQELVAEENLSWKQAEEEVSRNYFGFLDSKNSSERLGKVIFLDAYPLPQQSGNGSGLAVDIANNIWSWDVEGRNLSYDPNPNPFLSLENSTFLIGIRSINSDDKDVLEQVKQWLIRGLQAGIGSQVNTGYGSLIRAGQTALTKSFFSVEFTIKGQLIHGQQRFTSWNYRKNKWQMRGKPDAEVRPIAFRSMLRYWFRAFAQGVLPSREVQRQEAVLFGTISPEQARGWLTVKIADGRVIQSEARPNRTVQRDSYGEQAGQLILAFSSEIPATKKQDTKTLFKNLTWLMFRLGGIGQGARRPCYSRQNRDHGNPPWWRGSSLIPDSQDQFWQLPDDVQGFQKLFRQRLMEFYKALSKVVEPSFNPLKPLSVGQVRHDHWAEVVDAHCRIIGCKGEGNFDKPYALAVLHSEDLKVQNRYGQVDYNPNLCGTVKGKANPSPVWISDLGDYQIVTVFGANQDPRKRYLSELNKRTDRPNHAQIWPLQ